MVRKRIKGKIVEKRLCFILYQAIQLEFFFSENKDLKVRKKPQVGK